MWPSRGDRKMSNVSDEAMKALAANWANANTYCLTNPYLTKEQKAFVECWSETPESAFTWVILMAPLWSSSPSLWHHIVAAAAFSIVISLVFGLFPSKALVFPLGFIAAGNVGMLIRLCLIGYCFYSGWNWYGLYGIVSLFGIGTIVAPGMWIQCFFGYAGGMKMNPKYAIAKRVYGVQYPFENRFSLD